MRFLESYLRLPSACHGAAHLQRAHPFSACGVRSARDPISCLAVRRPARHSNVLATKRRPPALAFLGRQIMCYSAFHKNGFFITSPLLSDSECHAIEANLVALEASKAGSRSMLEAPWCASLARTLQAHPLLAGFLPQDSAAVQCTYFEKSVDRNWLVSLHQDLSIPVIEKIEHPSLSGWSEKEGGYFVQPPAAVLRGIVAVRLHIDECSFGDGPLKVVPSSHLHGRMTQAAALSLRATNGEVLCPVARGAAMLMRPLLLHSSPKASGDSKRRVLHFLMAPKSLPLGIRWRHVA